MKIRVTQKDIEKGKAGDSYSCPIVRAIRRRKSHAKVVSVGLQSVTIGGKKYKQPDDMFLWRQRFDSKQPVKPAVFVLRKKDRVEWNDF